MELCCGSPSNPVDFPSILILHGLLLWSILSQDIHMSATRGPRCPKSASWPPGPLQTAEGAAGRTDAQLEALPPNWINSKGESLWKGSCWIRWPATPEWKGKPLTTPNAGSLRLASPSAVKQAWLLCKWCVDTKEETHSKARLSLQLHVRCGC